MSKLSRRQARENAFIALFEFSFGADPEEIIGFAKTHSTEFALDEFGENLFRQFLANSVVVDDAITVNLKGWKAERIPRVNLAVLRLSVTEMLYGEPDIDSVAINEAVEITKKYADEADFKFVNGLLGSVAKSKPNIEAAAPSSSEE